LFHVTQRLLYTKWRDPAEFRALPFQGCTGLISNLPFRPKVKRGLVGVAPKGQWKSAGGISPRIRGEIPPEMKKQQNVIALKGRRNIPEIDNGQTSNENNGRKPQSRGRDGGHFDRVQSQTGLSIRELAALTT